MIDLGGYRYIDPVIGVFNGLVLVGVLFPFAYAYTRLRGR